MDTLIAFARCSAAIAAGKELIVFDWDKAAKLILKHKAIEASAGLREDWEYTGGCIFRDGKPVMDNYTYLASMWTKPELDINGEKIECWRLQRKSPNGQWNRKTK